MGNTARKPAKSKIKSSGYTPQYVGSLENSEEMANAEHRLQEAVKDLKIDTPFVRAFLERTAKQYIKTFCYKDVKKVRVHPSDFCFEIQKGSGGVIRVRVPISDFFKGKSDVDQRDYALSKFVQGQDYDTKRVITV